MDNAAEHMDVEHDASAGHVEAGGADEHADDVALVSVFTAEWPKRLAKRITRNADGTIKKEPAGKIVRGWYERHGVKDLRDLDALIDGLGSDQAIGVGAAAPESAPIASRKEHGEAPRQHEITRTLEYFGWPNGRAILPIDIDDATDLDTADDVRSWIVEQVPELADAPMLIRLSAGSCIHDTRSGEQLIGATGWRVYLEIANGHDVPRVGRVLAARLGETIDASVYSPERLDFAAAPICVGALEQRRSASAFYNEDAKPLDTEAAIAGGHDKGESATRGDRRRDIDDTDPIVAALRDRDLIRSRRSDGGYNVECVWADEHTTDGNGTDSVYFPAHTGGYGSPAYVCKHAHCAERGIRELRDALGIEDRSFDGLRQRAQALTTVSAPDDVEKVAQLAGESLSEIEREYVLADTKNATGQSITALRKVANRPAKRSRTAGDATGFETDQNGVVLPSQSNIDRGLERMRVELAYDEFAMRLLFQRDANGWQLLDDADAISLRLEIDERFGFLPQKEFFGDVVTDRAHRNTFHPVRDYLDARQPEWDGEPRIDRWLIDYGGAADTDYVRAVGGIWFVAAVRRVREPGVKFDELLILEAPQGMNKSEGIATVCPVSAWHSDDLPLNCNAAQTIERTAGKWIIEIAEMAGMRKTQVEHVKSFLSRQKDTSRLAYGRVPTERARHFVPIGTTNDSQYLGDVTGARRFWPVPVDRFDVDALARDRDQLWAEAAHREAQGESIRLPQELWSTAAGVQAGRRVVDPWETYLAEVFGDLEGKVASEEIWSALGKSSPRDRRGDDNNRLGRVMTALGFVHKRIRVDGRSINGYVRGDANQRIRVEPLPADPDRWRAYTQGAGDAY